MLSSLDGNLGLFLNIKRKSTNNFGHRKLVELRMILRKLQNHPTLHPESKFYKMGNAFVKGFTWLSLICLFCMGCGKPKELQYLDVENFKVNSFGLGGSVISADVKYYNPNSFRMKLKKAEMDVTVNNIFLGHSTLDTLMEIPKLDTFYIPVHMTIDVKALISNSLNALLFKEVDLKLEGSAKLGKAGIYKNFPFSYQGKQKFKLF